MKDFGINNVHNIFEFVNSQRFLIISSFIKSLTTALFRQKYLYYDVRPTRRIVVWHMKVLYWQSPTFKLVDLGIPATLPHICEHVNIHYCPTSLILKLLYFLSISFFVYGSLTLWGPCFKPAILDLLWVLPLVSAF